MGAHSFSLKDNRKKEQKNFLGVCSFLGVVLGVVNILTYFGQLGCSVFSRVFLPGAYWPSFWARALERLFQVVKNLTPVVLDFSQCAPREKRKWMTPLTPQYKE